MAASILFVDMAGLFLPMVKDVARQGFIPILTGPIAQYARQAGLRCHAFDEFTSPNLQIRVQQETARVLDGLNQALKNPRVLQEAFSSPLGDFLPHTGEQFFNRLANLVANEIAVSEMFGALVQQHNLALIVFRTEKVPFERTIIRHATRYDIPTLQIAHALYGRPVAPIAGEYERSLDCDSIAVFGKRASDILVETGLDPDRIFIIGSPYCDMLYSSEVQIDRRHACRQVGLDPDRPIVLFCASYTNAATALYPLIARHLTAIHRAVVQAITQTDPIPQLIVRPHPSEFGRARMSPTEELALLHAYKNWLVQQGISQVPISREKKVEAIRAADLVIVAGMSTVIPEVMILQRPVVMIPLLGGQSLKYTTHDGIAVVDVNDLAQLPDLVGSLLDDPSRREEMVQRQNKALPELNYGNDGRARQRLADLIVRLATESQAARRPRRDTKPPDVVSLPLSVPHGPARRGDLTVLSHDGGAHIRGYDTGEKEGHTMEKTQGAGFYVHQPGKLSKGAVLDVGLKCTHSCRFCYYSYLDGSEDQFIGMRKARFRTPGECKEILRLLKQNGFINFDYTGGEPSLHPDIIEITRYAHQELGLNGRMITLGQFLMRKMKNCKHDKLIDDLLEAGLTNFLFSLHAVDGELYHRITSESYQKVHKAMCYLDEKGFQYTTNTTVFEWNYRHLPDLAREVTKHGVYLHNFILMNAYYEWNTGGRAFGVQARYSDVYPYLKEAVDILESNYIGVNIRYAPLCSVRGMEKNLVGVVGVRYDPYEWMNLAGHMGGTPEFCASVIPVKEGEIEASLAYRGVNAQFDNGIKITGARGNAKVFSDRCVGCRAKEVCDGIDANYLKNHGSSEFSPYFHYEKAPLQKARYKYTVPFVIKTGQYTDMKAVIAAEFEKFNSQPSREADDAARFSAGVSGLTSIIVLNMNGYAHIRQCIESIKACTKAPYELIVVDNGSTDNSLEYLRSLPGIKLIENPDNVGAPYARNQGLAVAEGEYIVFLDNDTAVTEGWLQRFVNYANADPSVGVWGPRSNYVSGPQLVQSVRYSNVEELQAFSWGWAAANAGQASYTGRLILFCLFVKREVIQKIGGIDPAFGKWGWEDDDFGVRAQIAGYRLGIAHEIFVHHTGSQTSTIDHNALLQENWRVFQKKWNVAPKYGESMSYPVGQLAAQRFDPARHVVPIPPRAEVEKLLYSPDRLLSGSDTLTGAESAGDGDLTDAEQALTELFAGGQAALDRDDLETAAREFARVTGQFPDLAAGHTALGSTLMALGRVEEAIPALRRAAELVPQEPALHNQLGIALYQLGEIEAAEEAFQAALRVAPADPSTGLSTSPGPDQASGGASGHRVDALLNLIEIYRTQDRYVEATECVKQAMQVAPNDVGVLTAFGALSLELGDTEAARSALQHIRAIEPDQPVIQEMEQALGNTGQEEPSRRET